ncbi:17551_t:CDS:2 [Funneliformis geosporum]|uniref:17551_t:CDS:1 n=1 Tax=Funneliformis geosporum TaxID=1117311 RepID=A0A9W4STZ6_9GLOM|nr:17551_t:CDS:2 [Funneliformis geosporum]
MSHRYDGENQNYYAKTNINQYSSDLNTHEISRLYGEIHLKNAISIKETPAHHGIDYDTHDFKVPSVKLQGRYILYHESQDFKDVSKIDSGGYAAVYLAHWKITKTKLAIKKFVENSTKEIILNEIHIMEIMRRKVNFHPNIIRFFGITKLKEELNYALILEYADGGTLGKYLRDNAKTFKWKRQLEFANDMASAIKISDFGCSCLQGSDTKAACGVIPYMEPKTFKDPLFKLTKKSDIYSLGVLFWELTSCASPFNFESTVDIAIRFEILEGLRENSIPTTNSSFVKIYKRCWKPEPDERPDIVQVISELNSIDSKSHFDFKENDDNEIIENEVDLSDCDVRLYY